MESLGLVSGPTSIGPIPVRVSQMHRTHFTILPYYPSFLSPFSHVPFFALAHSSIVPRDELDSLRPRSASGTKHLDPSPPLPSLVDPAIFRQVNLASSLSRCSITLFSYRNDRLLPSVRQGPILIPQEILRS